MIEASLLALVKNEFYFIVACVDLWTSVFIHPIKACACCRARAKDT